MSGLNGSRAIDVDGVLRSRFNSDGQLIHSSEDGIRNFWRWFGDSRMVDDLGMPVVVYHGGTVENEFLSRFNGDATRHPSSVLGFFFTNDKEMADIYAANSRGNVQHAYLSVANPCHITTDEYSELLGNDELISPKDLAEKFMRLKIGLIDIGYDGVTIATKEGTELVVFDSKQIKSALSNSGAFNPDDSDIFDARFVMLTNNLKDDYIDAETSCGMS